MSKIRYYEFDKSWCDADSCLGCTAKWEDNSLEETLLFDRMVRHMQTTCDDNCDVCERTPEQVKLFLEVDKRGVITMAGGCNVPHNLLYTPGTEMVVMSIEESEKEFKDAQE